MNRGKWAVYEEGGDRAMMEGEGEVKSLYSVFFLSGGAKKRFVSCVVGCVCRCSIYIIIAVEKYRDCRSRKRTAPKREIGNFDLLFGGRVG